MHGVHSHRYIVALRMPVAVRASRFGRIRFRFHPSLPAVFLNHRAPTLTTHLEGDTVGIRMISCMTIETTSWHHRFRQDGVLIEGAQFALIDADIATYLIARFDATIGQSPFIKTIVADKDIKIVILCPMTITFYSNCEGNLTALVLLSQLVPLVDIKIGPFAFSSNLSTLTAKGHHIHTVEDIVFDIKVQWGDICRNRHTDIVGIDLR